MPNPLDPQNLTMEAAVDPMEEPAVIAFDLYKQQRIRADYCEETMWEAMANYERVCGELLAEKGRAEAAANHLARAWEAVGLSGYDHREDVNTVEDAVIAMDADLRRLRGGA